MKRLIAVMLSALMLMAACAFSENNQEQNALLRLEAEDGVLSGDLAVRYSGGTGWVEGFTSQDDELGWTINVPEGGAYCVTVILASMYGDYKLNPVLLDGKSAGQVAVTGRDFTRASLEYIYLTQGEHTLSIGTSWGWIKVDAVEISPAEALPGDLYDVAEQPVTPDPSEATKRLYAWLRECYGKKVISGQYCDGGMYGMENQAVWRATGGLYPALLGLDFMDYSPSRVEHGTVGRSVDQAIEYWNKGGIVTFCWHWNAPSPYLTEDRWYSGFYTEYTTFDLGRVMSGKDPKGYELLLKDIDAIAAQLTILRDAGVPVLFRPLHEASGGWFWWGASGPEAYLKLWDLLFEKLTYEYGLNNLIWVWNGQDPAWYPGDDTVDIIGEDLYPGERVYSSQSAKFLDCVKYTSARKIIMISENGCVPDVEELFRDGTVWGGFCTWGGEFVLQNSKYNKPSERYTEVWLLKQTYSDDRVITRKDIPDFLSQD
ncbi:MAG: beta-mannosidase [Clostridia bacterium]|nr:beta-mannosidase [Clostridia bacterium]